MFIHILDILRVIFRVCTWMFRCIHDMFGYVQGIFWICLLYIMEMFRQISSDSWQ